MEKSLEAPATAALAKEIVHEIAQALETEGSVKAVFGEPVKLENHTVIPVASLFVSIGGGVGLGGATGIAGKVQGAVELASRVMPGNRGGGGGGAVQLRVEPVGFPREEREGVTFTPIPRKH